MTNSSQEFDYCFTTIANILHELSNVCKKPKCVPYDLTEAQKEKHTELAHLPFGRYARDPPFLSDIIICGKNDTQSREVKRRKEPEGYEVHHPEDKRWRGTEQWNGSVTLGSFESISYRRCVMPN
ncbi:hypothetical protein KIN20_012781 [Parelaphostrongylus tenuis]|uniref:Uncharacterized protein n=1 Tax=Parelaphostrongylus tenuis TaxID=148309 RepID=A0AAD5QNC9_PARTN|nr:hypothetical protein KIN20_012781 [Parelaphostrongylus tenuis]